MLPRKTTSRRIPFLALGLMLLVLPACHSDGGPGAWTQTQPAGSANIAYRPIFQASRPRAFYPSTYAAYDYGPNRPRRNLPNCPVPAEAAPAPAGTAPTVTVSQGAWDTE